MRSLVTGATGFVGRHLVRHLDACGHPVVPTDGPRPDVRDPDSLAGELAGFGPGHVYHLAAQSSEAGSWDDPPGTWSTNVLGTLNVLEAVRRHAPHARVLVMSSAAVYEGLDRHTRLDEAGPVAPLSPYSASKAAAEVVARQYVDGFGLDVVIARAFNLIGPGQHGSFPVPSMIERIAAARDGGCDALEVGNADAIRDFVDVRDAVAGLRCVMERGKSGHAYNICSGVGTRVGHLVERLLRHADVEVDLAPRPVTLEALSLVGNPDRAAREVGWVSTTALDATLLDLVRD